jgi:anti-sigma regulatory factor (Ser/Thr protein kinase)/biotin operon repressor
MNRVRARGEDIRRFILEQVEQHPSDIAKAAAEKFGISRQAVNKHLQRLAAEKALNVIGKTKSRLYSLTQTEDWIKVYSITKELAEDVVWRNDILGVIGKMPDNVQGIWHYGFTEMFNNAIDHSEGTSILVSIKRTAATTQMLILDNGVGIFKKIQSKMGLLDERHAVLELSKGKLTTDPANHSGEGIFFTSRMFDHFCIMSGEVFFSHTYGEKEDWILQNDFDAKTAVRMTLNNHTARITAKVFDQYTSGEEFGFNKTVVPVKLAQYGNDQLISRSQAKRLLARVELFKVVVFDFAGVEAIGQAFADEIFRVFANRHPEIELTVIKANSAVKRMVDRAKSGEAGEAAEK